MAHLNKATERNQRASALVSKLFTDAEQGNLNLDKSLLQSIEVLFSTQTWGFREIILVIVVARLLDSSYKASQDFYSCYPRSLFEKPIRQELDKRKIPSRQSGPLNVAKGAERINEQWAAGRDPRTVANEVVILVNQIETMTPAQLENFAKMLLQRFLKEAQVVESLNLIVEPLTNPSFLYHLCKELIDNVPDSGNTPQRIIGYLLECYHRSLQTELKVQGHTDRASTTNTTSKKLGDITEEMPDGVIICVYEVTVKKFGEQRVREAYQAATSYGTRSNADPQEIIVICRKQDVYPGIEPITSLYLGQFEFQDIVFHYVDIYEWIAAQLLRMTKDARYMFFDQLQAYISDKNTSARVKNVWATLVDNKQD